MPPLEALAGPIGEQVSARIEAEEAALRQPDVDALGPQVMPLGQRTGRFEAVIGRVQAKIAHVEAAIEDARQLPAPGEGGRRGPYRRAAEQRERRPSDG